MTTTLTPTPKRHVHRAVTAAAHAAAESGPGLRVVCYYRMSSDEQAESIDQQKRECRAYAQRMGWVIVAEYEDAGKSGSKEIHKRVAFHRLIADSAKGEWTAVLCWDSSRFGRLDLQESAAYKLALRSNGVHLQCVREGRIDWNTSMGRLQDALLSEANHDYSVKLGGNSVRGRMDAIRQGYWPHGALLYGYQRQYWYDGKPVGSVSSRGERPTRARGWRLKLVTCPAEADAVRWLYEQFDNRDVSFRQMAFEMSQRGFPLPKWGRGSWNIGVVKDILTHPAYAGDTPLGYSRRTGSQRAFNRCERSIVKDTHPALVDRDTWNRVQEKLGHGKDRRAQTTGPPWGGGEQ